MKSLIVLKPSSATALENNVYKVVRTMFSPCPNTAKGFIAKLNRHNPKKQLGHPSVDKRWSLDLNLSRASSISLKMALELSRKYQCNILGGIFFGFLYAYGIDKFRHLGRAVVAKDDKEFMIGFYPDLIPYFVDPSQVGEKQRHYAQHITENNSGHFSVFEVRKKFRDTLEQELNVLAYLKRVYRYYIKTSIQWNTSGVRDNAIHTPYTLAELEYHTELLQERFI